MALKIFLWNVLSKSLSVVLGGESCLCCNGFSSSVPLCKSCQEQYLFRWIPSVDEAGKLLRCNTCGVELVSEIDICTRCRTEPVLMHVDKVLGVHSYRLWKKDLLSLWKLHGVRQLSSIFASLVSQVIRSEFKGKDDLPVVPVPPRPGKISKVGWDQVDELCEYLAKVHGHKVYRLLQRTTVTQQKELNRNDRLATLGKAYQVKKNAFDKHPLPSEVVLLDDVMTTGATIESCSSALKCAGVDKVYALTLFSVL